MSKDAFTWHPDQDDVYEGAVYGRTTLTNLPFSAFNKDFGNSFTMNGDDGDTLTLSPGPRDDAFWGDGVPGGKDVTEFNINGGTFSVQPPQGGGLFLGNMTAPLPNTIFNIRATFSVRETAVAGVIYDGFPQTTINIHPGGQCCISNGPLFSGGFAINVNDLGSIRVSALVIKINDGTYLAKGVANGESPSLELIAWRSLADPYSGNLEIRRHEISCKSASVSRLRAMSMSLADTHIRAEDTASLLVACDTIDVNSDTVFAAGQGSAVITFVGSEKNAAPFDFFNNVYPKGLFNFITTEGINKSTFKFLNIGSAYDFKKMQTDGIITIDGAPDTQSKCDWRSEVDDADRYFVIFLK